MAGNERIEGRDGEIKTNVGLMVTVCEMGTR